MRPAHLLVPSGLLLLAILIGCGGGSSSSSGSPPSNPPPKISITTNSLLPGTLLNHAYSVTLAAANGQGALTWSIAPTSSTGLFVDGLTIDPNTGVLSGTVDFGGTAAFFASVKDSSSPPQTATKVFYVTAASPLQGPDPQTNAFQQYQDIFRISPVFQGGVFPFTFSLTGSLPPGLRFDPATGQIFGSATATGVYSSNVIIQDSFSPPEVASEQLTITVIPPQLSVQNSLPGQIRLNRPFNGRVIATGGVPPYHFALMTGSSLPPGLGSIDPNTGQTNGTPTTLGSFSFRVSATDSSSPPQTATTSFGITVAQPLGRNDTIANATPVGNGQFDASISPYVDPPENAPLAADGDYYKLVSLAGTVTPVRLRTIATSYTGAPLDTVMEIVDGNGNKFSTCRQPGNTTSNFSTACINDDIGGSPYNFDSALDFQVPGATNTAVTFFVHVLDWHGNARPDMKYSLGVDGLTPPLSIPAASPLLPAARGLSYSQQLVSANGIGSVSWTKTSGNLPPGLALGTTGTITGAATTDGTYSFTAKASDSGSPPQTASVSGSIQVGEPVKITSSGNLPDACLNQPYYFAAQKSGGIPPFSWGVRSGYTVGIQVDSSTGVFSGSAVIAGTITDRLGVVDATTHDDVQDISLTVKQCP